MSRRVWLIIIICAGVLVGFGILNFNRKSVIPVRTTVIKRGTVISKVFPTGVVKAEEQVKVSSKTGGRLVFLGVEEGSRVEKGQLVGRIDDAELVAQLNQAQANLEQVEVDLETNKKNFERIFNLFTEKVVTEQQMDNARAQYRISQARIKQIQGQIELINAQIENTKISSPVSGIVFQKFASMGEMVNPGVPLVTVYDPKTLYIEVNVDEADIGKIRIGQGAQIVLDAYPGEVVDGVVSYIALASQDVKEKGVTFLVRIAVRRSGVILRLGMTADVDIFIVRKENVIVVPLDAVFEKDSKKFVFTIVYGRAKKKEIKVGMEDDEGAEVIDGLKEGEEIIAGNLDRLVDGKRVKLTHKGNSK